MPTALITGASMGIGEQFARQLAAKGYDLILVARSTDKLQAIATDLTNQNQITAQIIAADLTEPQACQNIFNQVQTWGQSIDLLINNAGFGDYGEFSQSDGPKQTTMVQLNVQALVDLTHLFLPTMQARQSGQIINVASIAAFQSMPYVSVYAATKAFVLSFSTALWVETQDQGIHVQCLCPGPTESNFGVVSGMDRVFSSGKSGPEIATAASVVQESLVALDRQQPIVVTSSLSNRLIAGMGKLLPQEVVAKMTAKIFQP
ncbi:SDR family oxidoreductase [filamentous cyanobacterium LEGE 11480]|uniref:SDR family oxidoreductase n=1 Tax=Romeriopsis navalis LEGE 11480 TaxID=2777977 RepID=A0A928VQA3_9CYAN|nr:SDR family oxidoreductase [Romeriopsis navalis]MBE9030129.1 SDR family oxidoreductase [Romeriopsis navalis LEGE 11480]